MTLAERTSELAPPLYDPGTLDPSKETVTTEGNSKPSFFNPPPPPDKNEYKPIIAKSWTNVGKDKQTWHEVLLPHNCSDHLLDKVILVHFYEGQEGMKSTFCSHCKAPVDIDIESLQKEILSPESISQIPEKIGLRFVYSKKPWIGRSYNILTQKHPEKISDGTLPYLNQE